MARVSDILAMKGSAIHIIAPEASVYDAIAKMVEFNIGALVVKDGTRFVGIFTERDYLARVTLKDRQPRTTNVREVMTARVICVETDKILPDCMGIMTREHIRHLPVVEGGDVVGMISIGDLVKHLANEHEIEIRYLTEYIHGFRPGT